MGENPPPLVAEVRGRVEAVTISGEGLTVYAPDARSAALAFSMALRELRDIEANRRAPVGLEVPKDREPEEDQKAVAARAAVAALRARLAGFEPYPCGDFEWDHLPVAGDSWPGSIGLGVSEVYRYDLRKTLDESMRALAPGGPIWAVCWISVDRLKGGALGVAYLNLRRPVCLNEEARS